MPDTKAEKKRKHIEDTLEARGEAAGSKMAIALLKKAGYFEGEEVDTDTEAFALLQRLEDRAEEDLQDFANGSFEPIVDYESSTVDPETGRKRYSIATKASALFLLEVMVREDDEGELIPLYSVVGELMSIDRKVLWDWWKHRKRIMKIADGFESKLEDIVKHKLNIQILRMVTAMEKRDFVTMSDKDFFQGFKTIMMQHRIMSGKSTQNVEHQHSHRGTIEMVPTDDM